MTRRILQRQTRANEPGLMRFHQLGVGQTFRLEGQTYTKLDSLMAVHAGSGQRRLIKRSAEVEPLPEDSDPTPAAPASDALSTATVLAAFDTFYQQCRELLLDTSAPAREAELNAQLERARQDFLDRLKNDIP